MNQDSLRLNATEIARGAEPLAAALTDPTVRFKTDR